MLFICATDEHGTPAELAALEAGQDVADYCAEQHEIQKDLGERFGLSWDWFGRTLAPAEPRTSPTTWPAGCGTRATPRSAPRPRCTRWPTDGSCRTATSSAPVPNCGYERARGDQCENCGKQLDPTELIEPRSAVSGSTDLEVRDSAHVFLLQSRLADRIRAWVDTKDDWAAARPAPSPTSGWTRAWRTGASPATWPGAFPVDPDDFPEAAGKVWYVWFDAPIGYLGATREWADERFTPEEAPAQFDRWWRTDRGAADVTYTQFMGKDNVPFHTLSFPATLLGSGEPWKLVDRLKSFNWLTYYGGKFSTSEHRGVFMSDALELLPADYWRWYLMANAPESDDASFTWDLFGDAVNKDLVGTFGNFVNRTVDPGGAPLR